MKRGRSGSKLADLASAPKRRKTNSGNALAIDAGRSPPTQPSFGDSGFPRASPEVLASRRIVKARRRLPPMSTGRDSSAAQPQTVAPKISLTAPTPTVDYSAFSLQDSVNQTGLWQMNASRRKQLSRQLPRYQSTPKPKSGDIRITAETGDPESWGVSADENVRTQILRDKRAQMTAPEQEMAYNQRSHQGALLWKTNSPALSQYRALDEESEPLSAHTPGYKSQNVPGTKGAKTKEHGIRDTTREQIVTKTLQDPKRGEADVPIMAKAATVQLFQSPQEELETVRPELQKMTEPRFSVFEDIGDVSGANAPSFDALVQRVQTVRETDKMHTARNLLISGYGNLVDPTHRTLLDRSAGDVSKAMDLLHQESQSTTPSISFNSATSSQTTRLDQQSLREMSEENAKKSGTHRPLSPVRRVSSSSYKFE